MGKIKVLHVSQAIGGVETYLHEMIKHIDLEKFDIVVVSSEPCIKKLCNQNNIKHYSIKMKRGFYPLSDLLAFFTLCKILNKEKPSLVHLHSAKAGLVGRIASITLRYKSVFTPHGGAYLSFTGFKRILYTLLEVIGTKFTHKLLAISHTEAYRFMHEIGIPEKDIYILPNALSLPETCEPGAEKPPSLNRKFKVGTIGRLTYQKNPLLFVDIANEVIKKNPDVHFYFLGKGFHDHLKHKTDEKIKQLGLENMIHFIDKSDRVFAIDFLKQLDVFILPSLYEGLPYALLEAMLEAIPCVVSKCDGNNDVIQNNKNGFACITKEEFAEIILYLIENTAKAKAIGEEGRRYVIENHNIKKSIQELQRIYIEIASA